MLHGSDPAAHQVALLRRVPCSRDASNVEESWLELHMVPEPR